ncbi:furin-1 [Biomphalaria pfeifferi]|uniref:Furin-1 n=1 Tax=Biomphalaria pfeifferi TaxID=112525 RepID=A0AAD8F545_BIOPF|nr:furin-1 [Biomphalaria pfeifferi]
MSVRLYSLSRWTELIWIFQLLFDILAANVYTNHFAVHIEGGNHVADNVARQTGFKNLGQIGSLHDHYLFEAPHRHRRSASPSHEDHATLHEHDQVNWLEQQIVKSRKKRDFHPKSTEQFNVMDPYWSNQWYLNKGAFGNNDMNVIKAWQLGFTGKNIVITILDDGLERTHPDLKTNYDPYASYDVNDHDSDPTPRYDPSNENRHGTRCAGEVSAEANNTYCTVGIAPNSRIGGVRMLDGEVYDAVEAASLSFNRSHIDIYSASWGPDDDGKVVDGPGTLAKKAFINGIEYGRGGKGSIFVWASGNGGSALDSCNCDGYANSIFTLSISSVSENGVKPWYLEECSSTLATTYSSGAYNEKQIASTDLHEKCTTSHTGTSASAPLAAGMVALILEANKDLTWRDVQYITLMTARPGPIRDGEWVTNGVGRKVSLRYGYGLMDAYEMVKLAQQWITVPEKRECIALSDVKDVPLAPHQRFTSEIVTDGCKGTKLEVTYLEHVQAVISLTYEVRGNVVIFLTSPKGTRSQLLPHRPNDVNAGGFKEWPFLSVHFWGENPQGVWTLEVQDGDQYNSQESGGVLTSWSLVFHGTVEYPIRFKNETTKTSPPPVTTALLNVDIIKSQENCNAECKGGCRGPLDTDCIECKNFHIGHLKKCVPKCPDGYYSKDNMCFSCEVSCASCSGPMLTQCLSCPPGHQLLNPKAKQMICSPDCLPGFYLNANTCLPCDPTCKECRHSSADCISCNPNYKLVGDVCLPEKEAQSPLDKDSASSLKSLENTAIIIIVVCLSILLITSLIVTLLFARRYSYLCWADKKFYGQIPRDEDDADVRFAYSDEIEEY